MCLAQPYQLHVQTQQPRVTKVGCFIHFLQHHLTCACTYISPMSVVLVQKMELRQYDLCELAM